MSKPCVVCGQEKSLTDFYAQPKNTDGHMHICKVCHKARMAKRRLDKSDEIQAYDRERGLLPHRKLAVKERAPKYKDTPARQIRNMRAKYPEKATARNILGAAVRDGRVIKPDACQECGILKSNLHGHHHDYSKPLDVRWLCTGCHGAVHRRENEVARAACALKTAAE